MTQHLDTEIRARVTDLEDADLQRIATDLVVSKSSLIRRGVQLIIDLHHRSQMEEESLLVNRFSLRQDRA